MGGLLSKLMVQRSSDALWKSVYDASTPIDSLPIPQSEKNDLNDMYTFEPLPFIKRVIFLGVPHQGSSMATSLFGTQVALRLIKLPAEMYELSADVVRAIKKVKHTFVRSLSISSVP
jgi:hypothetical protein